MKPIRNTVLGVTAFLFIYTLSPYLGFTTSAITLLFFVGNGLLIYMVYTVLTRGIAPKETWEEGYWYSDVDKQYLAEGED